MSPLSSLPPGLQAPLHGALRAAGDDSAVVEVVPAPGGSIAESVRLRTRRSVYFLKWLPGAGEGFFREEAAGLELLASFGARAPRVLGHSEGERGAPAFMLQEWVAARFPAQYTRRLGRALGLALAALHESSARASPPGFGLERDNFLGRACQPNGWSADWVAFFRDRRLAPQVERALRSGALAPERRRDLERLLSRLDEWLAGPSRRPTLLHGDLHPGNVLADREGTPVLIDPACYFGDREAELARAAFYRDFPPDFFAAYREALPLPDGFAERRDLYNLYHVLNGLNHGAAHYVAQLNAILKRYVRAAV